MGSSRWRCVGIVVVLRSWGSWWTVCVVQLLVPHIDSFPLFTYIPYTIVLTTFTAPMKLKGAAADAVELGEYPEAVEKDLYPPLVQDTSYLEFALRRYVDMPVAFKPSNPEEHVADIIARPHADGDAAAAALLPVEAELGERIWIPDEDREGRGRWMQEATFHSRMYLRYTPSFLTEDVKVKVRRHAHRCVLCGLPVLTLERCSTRCSSRRSSRGRGASSGLSCPSTSARACSRRCLCRLTSVLRPLG